MIESDASEQSAEQIDIQDKNICLSKIRFDSFKDQDIKTFFQVLAVSSQNRTVADLDILTKILMHIEPIKKLSNISAVFMIAKRLTLSKYKSKQLIFQSNQQSQQLYILLSGKIVLCKKGKQYFDSDEVVFLNAGSCLGKFYSNHQSFITMAVQESIFATLDKKDYSKIPMQLSYDRKKIWKQLTSSDYFNSLGSQPQLFQQVSQYLSINKIPLGSYIIRQNQTPKALFYILKGLVKKSFVINTQLALQSRRQIQTKRYTEGQFFPSQLTQPLSYNLVAESICEIIVIPKKILKVFIKQGLIEDSFFEIQVKQNIQRKNLQAGKSLTQTAQFFKSQLSKKRQWKSYRQKVLRQVIQKNDFYKKGFQFRK